MTFLLIKLPIARIVVNKWRLKYDNVLLERTKSKYLLKFCVIMSTTPWRKSKGFDEAFSNVLIECYNKGRNISIIIIICVSVLAFIWLNYTDKVPSIIALFLPMFISSIITSWFIYPKASVIQEQIGK